MKIKQSKSKALWFVVEEFENGKYTIHKVCNSNFNATAECAKLKRKK